jgi:hypothetical protein
LVHELLRLANGVQGLAPAVAALDASASPVALAAPLSLQ